MSKEGYTIKCWGDLARYSNKLKRKTMAESEASIYPGLYGKNEPDQAELDSFKNDMDNNPSSIIERMKQFNPFQENVNELYSKIRSAFFEIYCKKNNIQVEHLEDTGFLDYQASEIIEKSFNRVKELGVTFDSPIKICFSETLNGFSLNDDGDDEGNPAFFAQDENTIYIRESDELSADDILSHELIHAFESHGSPRFTKPTREYSNVSHKDGISEFQVQLGQLLKNECVEPSEWTQFKEDYPKFAKNPVKISRAINDQLALSQNLDDFISKHIPEHLIHNPNEKITLFAELIMQPDTAQLKNPISLDAKREFYKSLNVKEAGQEVIDIGTYFSFEPEKMAQFYGSNNYENIMNYLNKDLDRKIQNKLIASDPKSKFYISDSSLKEIQGEGKVLLKKYLTGIKSNGAIIKEGYADLYKKPKHGDIRGLVMSR